MQSYVRNWTIQLQLLCFFYETQSCIFIIIIIALYHVSPAMHKWMSRVSTRWCPMVTGPRTKATQGNLCLTFAPAGPGRLQPSWYKGHPQLRQFLDTGMPLRPVLCSLIPVPLCGQHASNLKVPTHCRDKGLGGAALGLRGTAQARKQSLARVPLVYWA